VPPRIATPPVAAALLVSATAVAGYSVVRYHPAIVLTYLAAAVVLLVQLLAQPRAATPAVASGAAAVGLSAALALSGVLVWLVPAFSYLTPGPATTVRGLLAGAAVTTALALALPLRTAGDLALIIAVCGYLAASAVLIRADPAPSIDVWYTLQGAADSLGAGRNIYREIWLGPPGVMAAFTYLPWTAVLLAPGRWLAGDVRYALVALTVLAALILRTTSRARAAAGAAALLLLLPGTATQVEQAWTEPLLLACLAGAAVALSRGRMLAAIAMLALGMACKQHLALLLPLLAAWPRFGVRRAVLTAGCAGVLVAPWLLADSRAFLDDTVLLLIRFPPMRFADSLYVLALNEWAWLPPFWLTGAVVLATLAAVSWQVQRRDPTVGTWLRWAALVLLIANLVNKQAFYNQYWLVAALVLTAWAVQSAEHSGAPTS
jgi:hypothetical protein